MSLSRRFGRRRSRLALAMFAVTVAASATTTASATAATRTIGPGHLPAIALDSERRALVAHLTADRAAVSVCRIAASGPCAPVAQITIPTAAGIAQLGHPSILRGHTTYEGNVRWFVVVPDHYANVTWIAESTNLAATSFGPPQVLRNEAFGSDNQSVLFGNATPSSLMLVDEPSFDSPSWSVARARKDVRGSWTAGPAPKASFTQPRSVFPELAAATVGNPANGGAAGQAVARTILIGKGARSAADPRACLYEWLFDAESSGVTMDPDYGGQDPGRQEHWRQTPGCIAHGNHPTFTYVPGGQLLGYALERPNKKARVAFFRYSLADGRKKGPKALNTDFPKGQTGVAAPTLTSPGDGRATLLWWAGKGQVLSLGVAHSSGDTGAGWTGKREIAKSAGVAQTLRGITWGDSSGLAVWEDGNRIKVAGF